MAWLKYTYMYGRMIKNPLAYGLTMEAWAVRTSHLGQISGRVPHIMPLRD
jgi:hypothetical protein